MLLPAFVDTCMWRALEASCLPQPSIVTPFVYLLFLFNTGFKGPSLFMCPLELKERKCYLAMYLFEGIFKGAQWTKLNPIDIWESCNCHSLSSWLTPKACL